MATLTTVYNFYLPVIGGDIDVWGGFHNDNFEKLDDLLSGVQTITPNLTEGAWKIGGVAVTPSAAELNVLNGITAGLTAAELSVLDGFTGNTADLNILSGASAAGLTATELLYVNGVTAAIQTQLNSKQASDATLTSLSGLSLVEGDLLYATGAETLARLAKGTAGQMLRINAGATAPEWATADQVGVGQTWQDVSGSRASATNYTNSTGRAIMVSVTYTQSNTDTSSLQVNGVTVAQGQQNNTAGGQTLTTIVPAGAIYRFNTGTNSFARWVELR